MDILAELKRIDKCLRPLGYCFTGLTAVNLYGYGIGTNVFDIAVESDENVFKAVDLLGLPPATQDNFDPYIHKTDSTEDGFMYYRVQGDIIQDPVENPYMGVLLQNKPLLTRRLEIYSLYDPYCLKPCAWIALTQTDELAKKYKYYWNRL